MSVYIDGTNKLAHGIGAAAGPIMSLDSSTPPMLRPRVGSDNPLSLRDQ